MPERDGYIAGVPCWTDTTQPDPEAALDFYGGLFGWQFENVAAADAPGPYYVARMRGRDVSAIAAGGDSATWNTYIAVSDADETAAAVFHHGGAVIAPPFDVSDAGRMGVFADPAGAAFYAWEPRAHKGAQLVNEPGTVVFNGLATNDPERARAFYGAVFGWDVLTLDGGFQAWTLAGYGDHLELNDPGLRERVAEMGATPGFENVVASLAPAAPGRRAEWAVTFSVEDADAAASRAVELGGRLVLPPQDAPWVRMAVIEDPQGATFVASQFVPENRDIDAELDAMPAAA